MRTLKVEMLDIGLLGRYRYMESEELYQGTAKLDRLLVMIKRTCKV